MKSIPSTRWTTQDWIVPPAPRTDIHPESMDGEALMLDPRNGAIHRLNDTALEVWRRCDGRSTTQEIAQDLTQLFDTEHDTILDHVEQLVAAFAQRQLFDLSNDS